MNTFSRGLNLFDFTMNTSEHKRFEFISFTNQVKEMKTLKREGEEKIGEKAKCFDDSEGARYFLLGVNEDIGPQANHGKPGSMGGFDVFLDYFLNIQSNEFLNGSDVCVLGQINQLYSHSSVETSRSMVAELDDFIFELLNETLPPNAIPILIGGGHNNSYPLIKWASNRAQKPINVINIDPHADMRPLEGRHSGNSFSYALQEGYLKQYHVVGLHQSYNSNYILDELRAQNCVYSFFDDYVQGKSFTEDLEHFYQSVSQDLYGVDLDLDAIENMPTSAITPSGISVHQARKYICKMAENEKVQYLHLPEAAPIDKIKYIVGKTLGYFVSDFIKQHKKSVIK